MTITIEEIYGVNHTVVWHMEKSCLRIYTVEEWAHRHNVGYVIEHPDDECNKATALPPMPRHPTAKDAPLPHAYAAPLLHAYAAHGLVPVFTFVAHFMRPECLFIGELDIGVVISAPSCDKESYPLFVAWEALEISHAMHNGERVEIAIREDV